jgi:putative oxidoreductase
MNTTVAVLPTQSSPAAAVDLTGRVLLAAIFVISGLGKIGGYAGTQGFMESMGVPGWTLPLVIVLEVLGGLALIVGYRTRLAALALAVFTLVAAVLFHWQPGDQMQQILFLKNVSMAGGLLLLVARGAGDWSLDARNARLGAVQATR